MRANIVWRDVEAMLASFGATIDEGAGSRVHVQIGERRATFHRPHPRKEASKNTVRGVRAFLVNAGIRPGFGTHGEAEGEAGA